MIAHTIQLALAPVFVLVAMGNIMNILSTRLGRIVDRARRLQDLHGQTVGVEHDSVVAEIRGLDRRIVLVTRAIRMLVTAGLAIGMTVLAGAFAAAVAFGAIAGCIAKPRIRSSCRRSRAAAPASTCGPSRR